MRTTRIIGPNLKTYDGFGAAFTVAHSKAQGKFDRIRRVYGNNLTADPVRGTRGLTMVADQAPGLEKSRLCSAKLVPSGPHHFRRLSIWVTKAKTGVSAGGLWIPNEFMARNMGRAPRSAT